MAIYDMASAIRQPDAGNFGKGMMMGQQIAQNRRANQARNALARLAQGDQAALPELMQADPEAGMKWQDMQRANEFNQGLQGFFKPATGATNVVGVNSLSALANPQPAQPAGYDFDGAMNYAASRGEIEKAGSLAALRDKMRPQSAKYYGGDAQEVIGKDGQRRLIAMTEAGPVELPYQPVSKPKYKFMDDGTVIDETSAQPVGRIPVGLSPAQQLQARIAFAGQNKPQAITGADGQIYWVSPGQQLPPGVKAASGASTATPSEDERKAAGWKAQMDKAISDMDAATKLQGDADIPGYVESMPFLPDVAKNASRTPARQKFVQASGAFAEAALRAATGAGINESEAKQKIAELTPQLGDSKEVRAQKRESLYMYLDSVTKRAGRAIPQNAASPGAPAKASGHGWKAAGYKNILEAHADYKRGRDAAYKAGNMDLVRQIDAEARADGVIK